MTGFISLLSVNFVVLIILFCGSPTIFNNFSSLNISLKASNLYSYTLYAFFGYRETTLEPRENLLKDVAKMVNQFEKKNKIKFYFNEN